MATVDAQILNAQNAANSALADANAFLNTLLTVSTSALNTGFDLAGLLPDSYNYATVPTVDFPIIGGGIRPDVSSLSIPVPPEAPSIVLTGLDPISLPVDDLLAATNEFSFFEAAYQSTLLDPLKVKLLADLVNGGYGIDTADEAALFNRARDREVELTLTRIDEAGRMMAARGFPLPPGELSIAIDRAYQEFQSKSSSISREIFVDSAKRFVENRRFTIEQVRSLEQILLGFHNSVQERAVNVSRATAEFAIAVYNALLERYKTRLGAAKISADVQVARAQIDVERARAAIGLFQGQVAAYEANIRGQVEPLRLKTELYRADIDGNRAITDGLVARASLQQKVLEATIQQNIEISRISVETAKAKLLAAMSGLQIAAETAKFGSQGFFAAISAMYGSINSLSVQTAAE